MGLEKINAEEGSHRNNGNGKVNQSFKYRVSFDGLSFHVQVPHFDGQVIPGDHVTTGVGEFDIRY